MDWLFRPVSWIQEHFYMTDPRDPDTGELLPAGKIRLAPYQKYVLSRALERQSGRLRHQTIVLSSPKKTLKTTLAAAISMWVACCYPYSEILLMANDGVQAHDRVFRAVANSVRLHQPISPIVVQVNRIVFPNGSVITPVPCDSEGIAGANPRLTVFTEVWAYTNENKHRLFAETVPPPGMPDALRLIESYAGYIGEGSVLERLWNTARNGYLDDEAARLGLEIWINPEARLFYFYDHGEPATKRLPWQTEEYYRAQAATLPEAEFRRIHLNEWVSEKRRGLEMQWFEQCVGEVKYDSYVPCVIGVDAGVVRSSFAAVVATIVDGEVVVVDAMEWVPKGVPLDYLAIKQEIVRLCERYAVVEIAYDPYQLHQMMSELSRAYVAYARPYPQQLRGRADVGLISLFQSRRVKISQKCADILRTHYRFTEFDEGRKRFVLSDAASPGEDPRNDAMVALSMAADRLLYYSIT